MICEAAGRMVTLKDIAQAARTDTGTVSRVLRNHPKAHELRPATRERILRIAGELGYQRNLLASSVRTGVVNTMALIARFSPEDFFVSGAKVIDGLLEESVCHGYSIKVYADSNLDLAFREISGSMIRLVVMTSTNCEAREAVARFCREKNLRLVYVFEHSNGEFPAVNVDNSAAARLAVRHLAEMGHRRIGLFCVPHRNYHYVSERHEGFLAGMAEAGLEAKPEWIVCTDERENAVAEMLSLPERNRPTALFGISDFLLLHVQRYAFLHGIRIPEDLSLVGMGNMEAGNFAVVPLTSIEEDHREFGKVAVRALLDKETGVEKQESGMYLLPPRLIRRASSAPPRKGSSEERSLS